MGEALASATRDAIRDELGDVLFSLVNVARLLGVDAEDCLRQARREVHPPLQRGGGGDEGRGPDGQRRIRRKSWTGRGKR